MPKKKTSRRSRFADDAALQALVRYEPEESGLKALAQQARADYGVSVRQAQTTGDLTLQSVKEALPSVSRIYDDAGLAQAKTASLVSPELSALTGPGAGVLQRGGALEVAQQLSNLRSAKAGALEDLTTRGVAARQGQQFGIINARQKFMSDMQKILGQSQSLARQKGAFTASTLNSLGLAAAERAVKRRGQDKTAEAAAARLDVTKRGQDLSHDDRVAARNARNKGAVSATGKKLATPNEHGTARDRIQSVVAEIKPYVGKVGRHKVAQLFLQGAPKDEHGEAIKAVPEDWLSIALDLSYDGHISARNKQILANRGYSLKELGFPTQETPAQAAERRKRAARGRTQRAAGRAAASVIPGTRR